MTLENRQLGTNNLIVGAERLINLRNQQRQRYLQGGSAEGNTLYADDPEIQAIDRYERDFQADKPIKDADLLAMAEYGADEADLQQVSGGRIESLKAQDKSGIGEDNRDARKFRGARRDNLPQRVGAFVETPSGKSIYVAGENAPNSRVSPEMREATILQELGLSSPAREQVPYQTNKQGQKRRNFGRVQKDENGEVMKERLKRVKQARPSGQLQNPDDIISVDAYDTARRSSYRGTGEDSPTEMTRTSNAPMRGQIGSGSAYEQLVAKLDSGEVTLDTRVSDPLRKSGETKTVGQILDSMLESADPQTAVRNARYEGRSAVREAHPVTAESLKRRSSTRARAEQDVLGLLATGGSTNEVIGETVMSDEAWKSKSQKQIPNLPVQAAADEISNQQVYQMVNETGDVVGYGNGARFIESSNKADDLQNLSVPTNKQNLINFITENLQYENSGALKDAVITTATQDFTEAARGLSAKRFGEGVDRIPVGIQSIGEAQQFVDRLIGRAQEQGTGFSRYNEADPSNPIKVPRTEAPTVSDLMSTMNVDRSSQGRLANALYQMALSEGSDINQEGKQRYASRQGSYQPVYTPEGNSESVDLDARSRGEVGKTIPARQNIMFDSPAGVFYDGVDAAYIGNSQRKKIDGENVNIQAALRGLKDPDARSPFIGAVAREPQPKEQYRKGFGQDVSIEQGYRDLERSMVKGKRTYSQARVDKNIQQARAVEGRFNKGEEDRAVRGIMQQADSSLADERLARDRQTDNDNFNRSRSQMLDSIREGNSLPGRQSGDDGFRLVTQQTTAAPTRERASGMISYNNNDPMIAAQARKIGMSTKQPIQPAQVAQSIAPDPWAGTGPARMESGGMATAPTPQMALPAGRSSRPMPADMRAELFKLDGPAQGPEPGRNSYRSAPDGPSSARVNRTELSNRMKRGIRGRQVGAGAAAAGGVAGLAALIGGERDQREQEQYS